MFCSGRITVRSKEDIFSCIDCNPVNNKKDMAAEVAGEIQAAAEVEIERDK